jgi:ubiquitin conjugation factor E4 B
MDATFEKIDRIDVDYLRKHPRVSIKDETKLNADQDTSERFYLRQLEGSNNFISEVFFLTVAAHHYGLEAANANLGNLRRQVKDFQFHLDRLEVERHRFVSVSRLFAY